MVEVMGKPIAYSPTIPTSLRRNAEAVVIQAAKTFCAQPHGEAAIVGGETEASERLREAVRVLKTLEGK